jgi:TPR repeat protein
MFGVDKNERKAKEYYAAFSTDNDASLLFGIDLKTGEGYYQLFELFEKKTGIWDKSAYPSFPESSEVELYALNKALEKKYAKAAKELSYKFSRGDGVRKDFLRSYAYLNLALGYAIDSNKKREYEYMLANIELEWKLSISQIIYAQQLSNEILRELKNSSEP